jgi:hypothetical protein
MNAATEAVTIGETTLNSPDARANLADVGPPPAV